MRFTILSPVVMGDDDCFKTKDTFNGLPTDEFSRSTDAAGGVAELLRLSGRDRSGDLVKRTQRAWRQNPKIARRLGEIEKRVSLNP